MSAVFLNLIHNAVEALGGCGQLSLCTERSGDRVEVLLQDNGRGMSAEELAQVFDPAFKIRGGRVSTGNWTLFSSRQIVREHGGEIEIYSLPGKGTTVRVFLPCSRDEIS
jgi:signal transduction histidine kinase